MEKPKKKLKKVNKKIATPTFNADINLDQEEPDIPEKVEKVEVDQISIVKKVDSKAEAQPLVVVREEKVQPFCIEESMNNSTFKQGKDGEAQVNQQAHISMSLVQDIAPQELAKPMLHEPPLQQKMKEEQTYQLQHQNETNSHTFSPVNLTSTPIENQAQAHSRQQPIQVQKESDIKKIVIEDDEQDQLALSLKEDAKSKAKTTKKTTKKSKIKPKAAASAIFAVQNMLDLDEFNDTEEVKPKSQIITHVESKRQEPINEIIEVKQPKLANYQQLTSAEPKIIENKVSEIIAEIQLKQEYFEYLQLKNKAEHINQEVKIAKTLEQDTYVQHIEESPIIKQQITARIQNKEQGKEEMIPPSNIQEDIQIQIPFSLQDNKLKPKNIKKSTNKGGKKSKVDKNKQLTEENIFQVKEIEQNESPKLEQIASQHQMTPVEKTQEPTKEQKAEKNIQVIEQKQEQIVPVFVSTEQKQKQASQQLYQSNQNKSIQQKEVEVPKQVEREAEPAITQQTLVIASQQKQIIEQPEAEPPKQEVNMVKKEVDEDQEIHALSLADSLKPKTNKTSKKQKKQKIKTKEEKNALIGENMLNFDQDAPKIEQPQRQQEKIEKVEEIPSKNIEKIQAVQQEVKPQQNEQIVQQQPLQKIIQSPIVIPQRSFTKPIQKPQQAQSSPPLLSSAPDSKKQIVSQLISLIRFHNDQEIKTMRQRMQMLQEDIISRMSRSKPSSTTRAPKRPDYQWIIQENISLHGQYKSLNKN